MSWTPCQNLRCAAAAAACAFLLSGSPPAAFAGSASTLNTSSNSNNNWAAMRGFDPLGVAGPGSSHPDTGDMSVYLDQSTEFGFGVTSGTSDMTICQGRVDCSFTANDNAFIEGGSAAMGAALDPATQPGNIGNSGYYLLSYTEDGDEGAVGRGRKRGPVAGAHLHPGGEQRPVCAKNHV